MTVKHLQQLLHDADRMNIHDTTIKPTKLLGKEKVIGDKGSAYYPSIHFKPSSPIYELSIQPSIPGMWQPRSLEKKGEYQEKLHCTFPLDWNLSVSPNLIIYP
jgi:hypothetical protein